MKVLELYSGIGGMHFALKGSTIGPVSEVVSAMELSPQCNEVYKFNFPQTKLINKNIDSLTADEVNSLAPDIILMSPPCQPFTRLGKQDDVKDPRTSSLLQIIKQISQFVTVSYILLENVKGFEVSETRSILLSALRDANFKCEEFLLNPRQFGICNSRLRYYLLARKTVTKLKNSPSNNVIQEVPSEYEHKFKEILFKNIPKNMSDIIEHDVSSDSWHTYAVSTEKLRKYFLILDIVPYDGKNSCCFTRGYTHYLEGTGSVISGLSLSEMENAMIKHENDTISNPDSDLFEKLNLRFFTPKEISRLMMFPDSFGFPENITLKQRYKMICNSINVYVVSFLISYLVQQ